MTNPKKNSEMTNTLSEKKDNYSDNTKNLKSTDINDNMIKFNNVNIDIKNTNHCNNGEIELETQK